MQDIFLFEPEVHCALMLSRQRRLVMNKLQVLSGVVCMSVLLATGAFAELLGSQPGTSSNAKDNVPKEIQEALQAEELLVRVAVVRADAMTP
jgi:hypothetical protein